MLIEQITDTVGDLTCIGISDIECSGARRPLNGSNDHKC